MMNQKQEIERLIFVFAANSGAFNAFVDSAKKLLMIRGCALCRITHGLTGEKTDWRECKEEIGVPIDYVHRDEITEDLRRVVGDQIPSVVAKTDRQFVLLLTPEVLERCKGSVADLKGRLNYYASIKNLAFPQVQVAQ